MICWDEDGTQEGQQSGPVSSVTAGTVSFRMCLSERAFPPHEVFPPETEERGGCGQAASDLKACSFSFLVHGEKSSGHLVAQD